MTKPYVICIRGNKSIPDGYLTLLSHEKRLKFQKQLLKKHCTLLNTPKAGPNLSIFTRWSEIQVGSLLITFPRL